MLAGAGNTPIHLAGWVGHVDSQVGEPTTLAKPVQELICPVPARAPLDQVTDAVYRAQPGCNSVWDIKVLFHRFPPHSIACGLRPTTCPSCQDVSAGLHLAAFIAAWYR